MNFQSLIGHSVSLLIPAFDKVKMQEVVIVGVEVGGIWFKSQAVTNSLLSHVGLSASPRSLAMFLPFHEISFAMTALDEVGLNESAFGV